VSLLILSHLPASDGSFYHVWKALGVDPYQARSAGGVEGIEVWQPPILSLPPVSEARTLLILGGEALQVAIGLTNAPEVMGAVWTAAEARAISAVLKSGTLLERLPQLETVVVSVHPADARGARWMLPTIYRFIARASAWSQVSFSKGHLRLADLTNRMGHVTINLSPTEDDVEEAFAGEGPVSVDIETPKGRNGEILLVGVAPTAHKAIVVDWGNASLRRVLTVQLGNGQSIVGHNFYYDHRGFSLNNIRVAGRVHDTITQASTLYPPVADRKIEAVEGEGGKKGKKLKIKWLSLQNCCLREFEDWAPWKRVEELRWVHEFYKVAFPRVSPWEWSKYYCGIDVIKTRALHDVQKEMMGG
jgi:hypothetical protein